MIPPNLTDYLQPPNLSVNKSFNNFVTVQYNSWYGEKVKDIDLNDHKELSQRADRGDKV